MLQNVNATVKQMVMVILMYALIGMMLILMFGRTNYSYFVGFVIGIVISIAYVFHMYSSLDKALDMDENSALNKVRKSYGIRVVATLVIMVLCIELNIGNPIFMLFGLISLKVAAYLQPFTDKLARKKSIEKGR